MSTKYDLDDLITLGRNMLARSEGMNTVSDNASGRANNLSRVGDLLTRVGIPFGTRIEEFSDADARFIMDEWEKFKIKQKIDDR